AKEKHGMRYTQYRGLRKVQHHLTLLFACMNLKKLAMWKRRQQTMPPAPQPVAAAATFFVSNLLFAIKKQLPKFFLKAVFVYSLKRYFYTVFFYE
ncbi:MAG: transposase, partial [Tepidanaerobacteraceae bacterium]